jgi:hypothetical protein
VGSLSKVLCWEGLAWSQKSERLDFVGFSHGEDPCGGARDDEVVFGGGHGLEPLGCHVLACRATNRNHRRVPFMDAVALAGAGSHFCHLELVEGDHPVVIVY